MHSWLRTLALFGFITLLLPGQSITGTIGGAVSDPRENPIVQASVVVVNAATNSKVSVATDEYGYFVTPLLPPGVYSVTISAAGFQTYQHDGIQLTIGEQMRLNVGLELGVITESVVVQGMQSVLEPTISSLDADVDNRKVLELPLNTRNVYSLVMLTPGVAGSIGNQHNTVSYSVNGTRSGFFSTLIDGAPADFPTVNGLSGLSLFPSVDAVEEFKLQAQNYPAEFGRTLTGVMNLIFKSGGNAIHGSAYEFLRNSAMDANTFFNNGRGIPLASFKRNQFGGTLTGPIRRDRTFFLLSYEGLRQKSFRDLLATVPTTAQRSGDFAETRASATQPILIYDPETTVGTIRQPFMGNRIPLTRWDPVARNILQYFPAANLPGDAATQLNNFYASGAAAVDTDNADIRADHDFSSRIRLSGRFSYRHSLDAPPQLFAGSLGVAEGRVNQNDFGRNAVLNLSDAVNGSTIWNIRLSLARNRFLYDNQGLGFAPSTLGFPKAFDAAVDRLMFPRVEVGGEVPLGGGDHRQSGFNNFALSVAVSKLVSRHFLKAGYDGRLIRDNVWEARAAGTFQFNSGFTQGPDATVANATAGYGLASFLLGTGSGGNFYQNWKNVATQSLYHAFYIQDDWQVTRKLTLNLGVRYDFDTPRTERYNRMSWFDPNRSSPLASQVPAFPNLRGGLQFVGVDGNGRSQFPGEYDNVAPRLGFAYQAGSRTVIRGAWGQSFGPSTIAAQGTVGPYGFRVETPWVTSLDNGLTPYTKLQNPFPGGFPPVPGASAGALTAISGNVEGPLRNTVTPYTLQWNFTIQRELPAHTLFQIAYVGNRGRQLSRGGETGFTLNQIDPKYLSLGATLNDRVDNPFYGIITTGALSTPQVSAQLLRPFPQFLSVIPYFSPGATSDYTLCNSP